MDNKEILRRLDELCNENDSQEPALFYINLILSGWDSVTAYWTTYNNFSKEVKNG